MSVTLLDNDEHSILARIRYPDRKSGLLYGKSTSGFDWVVQNTGKGKKTVTRLTLGIASVARSPGIDYLSQTLHLVSFNFRICFLKSFSLANRNPKCEVDLKYLIYLNFLNFLQGVNFLFFEKTFNFFNVLKDSTHLEINNARRTRLSGKIATSGNVQSYNKTPTGRGM